MKKILSLLSMLMITVMAFATDYTDQLTFKLTVGSNSSEKSLPQGTLTIEKRVDGTYNVTASGCDFSAADFGNWGDISCDGVAGTTNADGLTTIEVSKPEVFANGSVPSGYSLSGQSLLVKFNGTKAYALLKGKLALNAIVGYPFEYTFGTDEGFDGGSTGGGETGGETSSIVTVLENHTNDGSRFSRSFKIDWDKQKVVMSIDPTPCGNDLEHIVGLGVDCTQWDAALHVYNKYFDKYGSPAQTYNRQMLQAYFPMPGNNNNTGVFDRKSPFSIEVSKDKGFVVDGEVKISASQMTSLFAQANLTVGSGQGGDAASHAKYNYIKVVPLDWTEVPPVTVKETKEFKNVAYTTSMSGSGTATVTFTEMSDGTFPMTFVSDDLNVKAENLTKDTDAKGRTTYTGTAKRTDVDVTFTVKAVVYTEGTEEKLYMTMDNGSSLVVTVGEDPDAPKVVATVPFTGVTLSASNGVTGTADVTFKEMSDNTVQMTFNGAGYGISATNLTKGTDTKGRTTYTGEAVNDAASTVTYTVKAVVYTEGAEKKLYMTMVSVDGTTFTVGEDPDYVAPEPEIEGTVVEGSKNYAANGSKFEWSNIAINWNKQKLVAVIDLSSCTGTSENILSVGQNIGSWSIGGWHFYYTVASKKMKSDYLATGGAHPVSDPKTGVEPGTVRIELSKAEGCTIDGVSYNALYDSSVTGTWQSNTEDFWNLTSVNIGSKEGANRSNAVIKYVTVVDLPVTVKDEKTFNEALYMQDQKVADATVVVKEMSDETINMSLKFGENEYTSTELTKGTDEKNRTTYTGKVANGTQTYDVAGVVYEKDNVARLYMTLKTSITTVVVGENPDVVTPEVTEVSNKTYTNNLRILDGETTVVEEAEANVNIVKYSDESYKVTLKNVNMLNKTQDLVFVGKALIEEAPTEATEPLTIIAKSDAATTEFFGEEMSATFEITEVSAEEIKMGFVLNNTSLEYQGEFNYEKKNPDTPDPEKYPINFDKTANSTHNSRALNSFSLQQAGKEKQTKSVKTSKAAYEDHTADEPFTVEAGSELTASFDYTGEWMHSFVYIDFDNDGDFSYKEGQWNQTGTDLVAFSFYSLDSNPKNDTSGYNSVGDELTGDARNTYAAPSFKAPAKAGEYRIRFKFDWNCILPGGSSSILSDGGGVWDATLKVVEPVVDGISTINAEVANGEAQLFTVNGVKLNKLQKGLNIVRTADGKVKKVLVK